MMPEGVVECSECGVPCRGYGGGRCDRCERMAEDRASRGRILALVDAAAAYRVTRDVIDDDDLDFDAAFLAIKGAVTDAAYDVTPDDAAALRRLWGETP